MFVADTCTRYSDQPVRPRRFSALLNEPETMANRQVRLRFSFVWHSPGDLRCMIGSNPTTLSYVRQLTVVVDQKLRAIDAIPPLLA